MRALIVLGVVAALLLSPFRVTAQAWADTARAAAVMHARPVAAWVQRGVDTVLDAVFGHALRRAGR